MTTIRVNKFLAECGISSRRKAEEYILQGRVQINNETVISLSTKVNVDIDVVTLDGEKIKQKKHIYILLNKPKGFVSTTDDEKNRKTVLDLLKMSERIFPIGRLDYNTTGVLLLTNDGEFANTLLHPSNKIKREYEVELDKNLEPEDENKLLKGIYINNIKGKFEKIFVNKSNHKFVKVVCIEGRNHFVKNMFKELGYFVNNLNRYSFGGFTCADLPVGAYRFLSISDIKGALK